MANPIVTFEMANGDIIKAELYPEKAPNTVNNFISLVKKGFYNGLIFHRVIAGFMIQGGDPMGTGIGGESIWGRSFEDEFTPKLHNLRGALSMANAGPNTNGSQFFIVQAKEVDAGLISQMEQLSDRGFPTECVEDYKALGGTPWLDFKHTVFGQVYEGMDVVAQIMNSPTDENGVPSPDVKIITIEITTFVGE